MRLFLLLSAVILIAFTGGCGSLDVKQTSIPIGIGYEWVKENEFKMSTQIAKPMSPEQGESGDNEDAFIVVSETGESITMATRNLMLTLPRYPLWTYTSLIVLGENLVSNDIAYYADILLRNPNVRNNAMLVVCKDTTPEKLLQVKTPLEPLSALAITQILEMQEKQLGFYVPVTIGDFAERLSSPGSALLIPTVTVIKDENTEAIKFDGGAIIADRLVGHLNERECRGYRWLNPGIQMGGIITIPAPGDYDRLVGLEIIRFQSRSKPYIDDQGNISMNIHLNVEGNFYEQQTTKELINVKGFRAMEKLAAEEIEKQIAQTIIRAQELNADIFGWGELIHDSYPEVWKEISSNKYDYFPNITTNIKVDFSLRRTYLTDKSFKFR